MHVGAFCLSLGGRNYALNLPTKEVFLPLTAGCAALLTAPHTQSADAQFSAHTHGDDVWSNAFTLSNRQTVVTPNAFHNCGPRARLVMVRGPAERQLSDCAVMSVPPSPGRTQPSYRSTSRGRSGSGNIRIRPTVHTLPAPINIPNRQCHWSLFRHCQRKPYRRLTADTRMVRPCPLMSVFLGHASAALVISKLGRPKPLKKGILTPPIMSVF